MSRAKPKGTRTPRNQPSRFEPFVNERAGLQASGKRVGFPANRTVNLVYASNVTLTNTTGAAAKQQYRLNSAYDPDFTNTGHQPMGFDQWAEFYNHYVVEECSYQVTVIPVLAAPYPHVYVAHVSDDSFVPTSAESFLELGGTLALWAPGTPAHVFRGKVDVAKFFNRSAIESDPDLRATTYASPAEQVFLTITAIPTVTDTISSTALVTLTMKVRFMEPIDLAPSLRLPKAPGGQPVGRPSDDKDWRKRDQTVVTPPGSVPAPAPEAEYEFVTVRRSLKGSPTN